MLICYAVATQDTAEDEELFAIPRSSILTTETVDLPKEIREIIDDPWLALILAMVYDYNLGVASPWRPYWDVLPTEFDTLMFWSEQELSELEGSAVVNKLGKETADENFKEKLIPTMRQHSALFNLDDVTDEQLLIQCHRMGSLIMAYAFDLEKPSDNDAHNQQEEWEEDSDAGDMLPKGMVPLADMLNADADRNNAKLFYEDDKVVMKSIKPIKAGEEIFNDYGPLPRADVLRRYGYVTDNYAKYDVVEIPFELISVTAGQMTKLVKVRDAGWEERMNYLEEQGVLEDGYDISKTESEGGPFTEELCVLLNTITTEKAEFDKLKKKDKLPKPQLSKPSMELLLQILSTRRAMYPTRQDSEAMEADDTDSQRSQRRRQMALQVIAGEKEVLHEAINHVQGLLGEPSSKKRTAEQLEDSAANVQKMRKRYDESTESKENGT